MAWVVPRPKPEGSGGCDHLGACSYRDTAEFIAPGGYYDDMRAVALDNLRAVKRGEVARTALSTLPA